MRTWNHWSTAPKTGKEFLAYYPYQNVYQLVRWSVVYSSWMSKESAMPGIDYQECVWTSLPRKPKALRKNGTTNRRY